MQKKRSHTLDNWNPPISRQAKNPEKRQQRDLAWNHTPPITDKIMICDLTHKTTHYSNLIQ